MDTHTEKKRDREVILIIFCLERGETKRSSSIALSARRPPWASFLPFLCAEKEKQEGKEKKKKKEKEEKKEEDFLFLPRNPQ